MWSIVQCAVQGRSHISSGTPCQDKTYSTVIDDVYVITLADGAGSAWLSQYGAEAVTRYICSQLAEHFTVFFAEPNGAVVKQQIIEGIISCLQKTAQQQCCELKDLALTLLCTAVKDQQFIAVHIGDGVIGYLKNGAMNIASHPENGEFVNTTVFTTSKDAIMAMKLIKGTLGAIAGFVLLSDGTEASLYNKRERKLANVIKKIMNLCTILPAEIVQEQLQKVLKLSSSMQLLTIAV